MTRPRFRTTHGSRPIIGVFGGHAANTISEAIRLAEITGQRLADDGAAVACGGEDGIMEAVCRGAKSKGGTTIAIMKGNRKEAANRFVDIVIPTSLDLAFMNVLAWSSDGIIAFDGRFGTLCEIGLVLDIGRPLVLLGRHELINTAAIRSPNCLHLSDYSTASVDEGLDFLRQRILV